MSVAIPFLKLFIPFATSPIKLEIFPRPNKRTTRIATIAISSNDIENYPQDGPQQMVALCKEYGISFPYLYDPTQEVAKAYDAACTPDFYLFDDESKLVYRGRYDASRPQSGTPITGEDLKNAALNLINKKPISENQFPSMGCNIKWK